MKYPFSPEILDSMPEKLAELYRSLEVYIIRAIGEQLRQGDSLNESSIQKIRILKSHGIDLSDIEKEIRNTAKISKKEFDQIFKDAIKRNESYYRDTITKAKFVEPERIVDQRDIDAIAKQTLNEFVNITQSMGFLTNVGGKSVALPPAKAYQWALDNAEMQVHSGAISYNQAISNAIKSLADKGMAIVTYDSGHVDKLDVAVRRAIMTGVSQLCDKYTVQSAEYLETPYFEVSAHMGARDKGFKWQNHKAWQGKVYSIKQGDKYPSIYDICGLGMVDGLEGANCRHRRFAFVDGVSERTYTDDELKNIDKPNFTYQGKEYTTYEATQEQRRIERTVRKYKRLEEAYKSVGDIDSARAISIRRQRLQRHYKAFSNAAQLPEQTERMKVYTPSKTLASNGNSGTINAKVNTAKSLDIGDFMDFGEFQGIPNDVLNTIAKVIKEQERNGGMYVSDFTFTDDMVNGSSSLLETDITPYGMTIMRGNKTLLSQGVERINDMLKNASFNLPESLEEAVIHECGHARSYYQKSAAQVSKMQKDLEGMGVDGISDIASADGNECIAEVEVLLYRHSEVPENAMNLYLKYTGGFKK